MKKIKTINLSQGGKTIEYAKVSARIAEIHKNAKNVTISTNFEFKEGWAIFKATVIPDCSKPERYFNGHSMGKTAAIKAFEKLETIAVGRALAFAGYLSDGEIASMEEMASYNEALPLLDNSKALEKLRNCKNKEAVRLTWIALSQAERDDKEVEALKNSLKQQYENTSSGTENPGLATAPEGKDNGNGAKKDSRVKAGQGQLSV